MFTKQNFNPRPPRGGRLGGDGARAIKGDISIHAPREGGDALSTICAPCCMNISIHAPREGGDRSSVSLAYRSTKDFNPRPPRGGRHRCAASSRPGRKNFNPRPPRGGRPARRYPRPGIDRFQSTPPARGATPRRRGTVVSPQFQSTPPARGATFHGLDACPDRAISIHAPREGGDSSVSLAYRSTKDFNPRPPRGGRQQRCTVLPADL